MDKLCVRPLGPGLLCSVGVFGWNALPLSSWYIRESQYLKKQFCFWGTHITVDIYSGQRRNISSGNKQGIAKQVMCECSFKDEFECVSWGRVDVWWEMSFHVEKATCSKEWRSETAIACCRKSKELGLAQKWVWALARAKTWPLLPAMPLACLKAKFSPWHGVHRTQMWA